VKRTPILLTDAADQDQDNAAAYIAGSQDPDTAARFLKAVDEIFDLLARHPRIGRVIRVSSMLIAEMRILQIKGFQIIWCATA